MKYIYCYLCFLKAGSILLLTCVQHTLLKQNVETQILNVSRCDAMEMHSLHMLAIKNCTQMLTMTIRSQYRYYKSRSEQAPGNEFHPCDESDTE